MLRTVEWTLAKIRERAQTGVLVDAFADPAFDVALAHAVAQGVRSPLGDGELRFVPTEVFPRDLSFEPVQFPGHEQSNTSVILGGAVFLKGYRQARTGVNPDVEISSHLTRRGFKNSPALYGAVEFHRAGEPTTLAALFAFIRNQGDAWTYTLNHLDRFEALLLSGSAEQAPHALFMNQMKTLGRRVGELHAVLAQPSDDPAFVPEPTTAADLSTWRSTIVAEAEESLRLLASRLSSLHEAVQASAARLLDRQAALLAHIDRLLPAALDAVKTRHHADLHLGQVLLTADDFLITDFEGEPARSIEERRRKGSVLRDVAGVLRSFDYARAVALDRVLSARPDLLDRVAPAFEAWYHEAGETFLQGYFKGAGDAACIPQQRNVATRLITLFQIEKAFYELRYELGNRPAWAGIPISGLLSLFPPSMHS